MFFTKLEEFEAKKIEVNKFMKDMRTLDQKEILSLYRKSRIHRQDGPARFSPVTTQKQKIISFVLNSLVLYEGVRRKEGEGAAFVGPDVANEEVDTGDNIYSVWNSKSCTFHFFPV